MVTQAFWKGFRNRVIVSGLLLATVFIVGTTPIEFAWSEILAWSSDSLYLHPRRHELGFVGAIVYFHVPGTPWFSHASRIASNCTYAHLAAILLPFLVRRVGFREITRGLFLTIAGVGIINFIRLRLFFADFVTDWSILWYHDIPYYAGYTLSTLAALWYYYRSTLPRDAGSDTEAATDGSAQTVNA